MANQLVIPLSSLDNGATEMVEAIEEKRADGWYGWLSISFRATNRSPEETPDQGPFPSRELLEKSLEETFDEMYPLAE
jgi:hypothetical protein